MLILDFVLRLGAALLLGACVGLERQWRQRMAGTRTNALVSAGASAFVMCAFMVRDTSRSEAQIVSYVVSGVGFLGAGVIFKDAGSVRGLNTAATIWCSAAIGVLAGAGYAAYAAVATGFILFVNLLLRPIVAFINRQPLMAAEIEIGYVVSVTCRSPDEAHIRALLLQGLASCGLALRRLDSNDLEGGARVAVAAMVTASHRVDADVERIVGRLSLEPTVSAARWQADMHFDPESPQSLGTMADPPPSAEAGRAI